MGVSWIQTRFLKESLDRGLFKIVRDLARYKRLVHNAKKPRSGGSKIFFEISTGHTADQIPNGNRGKVIYQCGEGKDSSEGRSKPAGVIDALMFSIFSTKYFKNFSPSSTEEAQTVTGAEFTTLLMALKRTHELCFYTI